MKILIALLVVLSVVTAFLAYTSRIRTEFKLFVLPLFLLAAWAGTDFYITQLGRPIYDRPTGEFSYVMHAEVGNTVELVAADDKSSRLYIFEPTEEEKTGLKKANGSTEAGVELQGKFVFNDNTGEGSAEFWPVIEPRKE